MPSPIDSSRVGRCHQASFCADNTLITIVPSFHYSSNVPLLSCPTKGTVGPFVAGMPVQVPLWMARLFHQRQLAQIHLPEWLSSTTKLVEILQEEKASSSLTNVLDFYYYETARALAVVTPKSTQIVLADLVQVRLDKLRQTFHEVSKGELQNDDELSKLDITGICSVELQTIGPFLQRAFSDYGFLTHKEQDQTTEKVGVLETQMAQEPAVSTQPLKRTSMLKSRLRRFRD
jgi:GINS complex subunit 2